MSGGSHCCHFLQRQRTLAHIGDDVPETPPAEAVSTLGDEILDFYEPDEDLKLEDIIPDFDAPSPEEEAARSDVPMPYRAGQESGK